MANPNTLTAGIPALWSKKMQVIHHKKDVFRDIASFSEEGLLSVGDTVHKPYRNKLVVSDTGADGSFTRQALTQTDETLVIDKDKNTSFYTKELDKIQNQYDFVNEHSTDAGIVLSNAIDADVLAVGSAGAATVVDNSWFGGTAGDGISLNTANIVKVYTSADSALNAKNIDMEGRFDVISSQFRQVLVEAMAGRETILGDDVSTRGRMGEYMGFSNHLSNQLMWTGELLIGTLPTNGDTVTINGVVFTFVTGTPTNAGDVKAVTDGATSATNLKAAINAIGTTSATYIAVSAANQVKMYGISAGTLSGGAKFTAKGASYVKVSETLTAAADIWTAARQLQHNLFGKVGSIDVAVQKSPSTDIRPRDGYIGHDIISWEAYGAKVFSDGADALVDVLVNTSSY